MPLSPENGSYVQPALSVEELTLVLYEAFNDASVVATWGQSGWTEALAQYLHRRLDIRGVSVGRVGES
ncbi:MAG TPA: hypothetical protein VLL25_04090 [Acidimicrobiales bacterium]|nr:hypothetical protein [Acidimicrobiales bacterium]